MHTITDNGLAQRAYEREESTQHPETSAAERSAPVEDIEKLVVRIAGSDDADSIDALAERAGGARRPDGALMLAAVDGRVLAAASLSRREAVNEPNPSGLAARAVVEYTLVNLERRGSLPRRAA
jgi:hypothetical protein